MRTHQTKTAVHDGTVTPPPSVLGVSTEEWRALITARPNLLLVGDEAITSACLRVLWPTLQEPVWLTTGAPLSLPASSVGTLIVQDGNRLAPEDQGRLLQRLPDHQLRGQPVPTTRTPPA